MTERKVVADRIRPEIGLAGSCASLGLFPGTRRRKKVVLFDHPIDQLAASLISLRGECPVTYLPLWSRALSLISPCGHVSCHFSPNAVSVLSLISPHGHVPCHLSPHVPGVLSLISLHGEWRGYGGGGRRR